jgi:prepilin-type N-terminal cleavage/methylation domain-containing protein
MKGEKVGFTLIELLVVITVITLLTGFSVPAFISFQKSQVLNTAAGKLKEDLRLLQSKATAAITLAGQSQAWGVHLVDGSNSYRFFSCVPDPTHYEEYRLGAARCTTSVLESFEASTLVTRVSGATEWDVVFDVLTGTVVANGGVLSEDLPITVAYTDGSESRVIRLGPGGSIGD